MILFTRVRVQLSAHSKGPKRVGVPPSPEDGNRSSFPNVVFFSVLLECRKIDKVQNQVILSDVHHRLNALELHLFMHMNCHEVEYNVHDGK
jgi:hypothetical protein